MVDKCTTLLKYLSSSSLKTQPSIIAETWDYIAESGFLALLDGFAKIYDCSTEGRALMSIDLATFATTIPSASPTRGMQYVDMYIKVFYFPEEVRGFVNNIVLTLQYFDLALILLPLLVPTYRML